MLVIFKTNLIKKCIKTHQIRKKTIFLAPLPNPGYAPGILFHQIQSTE